jgi:hypothetical protein
MQYHAQDQLWLIQDQHQRQVREAEAQRLVHTSRPARRSIGPSLLRIGRRLAGAPRLELADSR